MSTVVTSTSVFTNREFPFKKINLSDSLEKRNRKYYIDYDIEGQPIFFQINKVVLGSEPIFIDEDQGYIDVEVKERIGETSKFFLELDNFNQVSCFKNCEEWLGKSLSMKDVESVYKSSFKNNFLRVKIERDNIKIFDTKKNKLDLENDIKVGNILDIIVEISGLKVMKNAFATHLVLRQIRKNPDPIPKAKLIPNEYLFLDDYSVRNVSRKVQDDKSIDSQTDVDVLVKRRKQVTKTPSVVEVLAAKAKKELSEASRVEPSEEPTLEDLDLSVSELRDPDEHELEAEVEAEADAEERTKVSEETVEQVTPILGKTLDVATVDSRSNVSKTFKTAKISKTAKRGGKAAKVANDQQTLESFDIEKDDLDTKEYLESVEKLNNIMNNIFDGDESRKDNILNRLEAGEITLGSINSEQSEKAPTKKPAARKKGGAKGKAAAANQLYKNL
jgi:hypothetical protein